MTKVYSIAIWARAQCSRTALTLHGVDVDALALMRLLSHIYLEGGRRGKRGGGERRGEEGMTLRRERPGCELLSSPLTSSLSKNWNRLHWLFILCSGV